MIKVVLVLFYYNILAFQKFDGLDLLLGFTFFKKCRSIFLTCATHGDHKMGWLRDTGLSQYCIRFVPSLEPQHLGMNMTSSVRLTDNGEVN